METEQQLKTQPLNVLRRKPSLTNEYLDRIARQELGFFSEYVLGYKNGDHHYEWYDILQNRLMTAPDADMDSPLIQSPIGFVHRRIALFAPRNHAKSTAFTVNYSLWKVGNTPNIRILIVSSTATQAQSFLREIKSTIEKNKHYRRVFGKLFPEDMKNPGEKWTNLEIIVRRDATHKDPTVTAVGAGGAILSKRADIIICDDILSVENTRTAEQRDKIRQWFRDVLMPVLEPDGLLINVGTAWNMEDLLHELMAKKGYTLRHRYKAVLDNEKQETLWPGRWPYSKMMELKEEVGTNSFNKSYQNEAMGGEDAIFQYSWLERAKRRGNNRSLIYRLDYPSWDLGQMVVSMGVDLAISTKDGSDFCAFAVIGMLKDGTKIPLHLSEQKLSFGGTQKVIKDLYRRFNPGIIVVESNAYQQALVRDMQENTGLPIKGYGTGGEKYDEEVGLNSMAVEFENDKWILPYSSQSPITIDIVDKLVEGMKRFPSGHTADILMSTWFANGGLRQLTFKPSGQGSVKTSKKDPLRR